MTETLDYSGRTVDLFIFQNAQPQHEQKIHLGFGEGGFVTTGVQKMSQTFCLHFLTERGSIQSKPDRGTGFLTALRIGSIMDESSLQSEFVLATQLVKRIMSLTADQDGWPDDEILDDVKLLNFSLDKTTGFLSIKVQLTSRAGVVHDLYLPLSVAPR